MRGGNPDAVVALGGLVLLGILSAMSSLCSRHPLQALADEIEKMTPEERAAWEKWGNEKEAKLKKHGFIGGAQRDEEEIQRLLADVEYAKSKSDQELLDAFGTTMEEARMFAVNGQCPLH
jgi:tRNA nucleotidyltransferase/poly(A) polymerase